MSWVSDLVQNMEQEGEATLFEGSSSEQDFSINKEESNSKSLSCDICRKTFEKLSLLVTHIVVYHGKYDHADGGNAAVTSTPRVSRRNRKSGKARLYMVHKYLETNKPFACGKCTQRFAYKYELHHHLDSHVEKTKYTCVACKREFLEEEHLLAHIKSKPYDPSVCEVCGKKCCSWTELSAHRLEHVCHDLPAFRS